MELFISTQSFIDCPFENAVILSPRMKTVNIKLNDKRLFTQMGFLPKGCSPLGWYQSIFRTTYVRGYDKIYFDKEPPIQLIGEFPDRDKSGISKVDKEFIDVFNKKYPPCGRGIETLFLSGDEVDRFNDLIYCTGEDWYAARYIPNATMRIIECRIKLGY